MGDICCLRWPHGNGELCALQPVTAGPRPHLKPPTSRSSPCPLLAPSPAHLPHLTVCPCPYAAGALLPLWPPTGGRVAEGEGGRSAGEEGPSYVGKSGGKDGVEGEWEESGGRRGIWAEGHQARGTRRGETGKCLGQGPDQEAGEDGGGGGRCPSLLSAPPQVRAGSCQSAWDCPAGTHIRHPKGTGAGHGVLV